MKSTEQADSKYIAEREKAIANEWKEKYHKVINRFAVYAQLKNDPELAEELMKELANNQ